jgi:hypothetical protein
VTVVILAGTLITSQVDLEEGMAAADAEDAAYLAEAAEAVESGATEGESEE